MSAPNLRPGSDREYQIILAFNPGVAQGSESGVALASISSEGEMNVTYGRANWDLVKRYFNKLDMVIGVYRGDRENALAAGYCAQAEEAGCRVHLTQPHIKDMALMPTRPQVALRGLEYTLGTYGLKRKLYPARLDVKDFNRMVPRRGA